MLTSKQILEMTDGPFGKEGATRDLGYKILYDYEAALRRLESSKREIHDQTFKPSFPSYFPTTSTLTELIKQMALVETLTVQAEMVDNIQTHWEYEQSVIQKG